MKALSALALAALVIAACSSDKEVETASCSSSVSSFDAATCQQLGAKAGCETSTLTSTHSCSFERCDSPPSCTTAPASSPPTANDAGADATVTSDSCTNAGPQGDGFFTKIPPCADYSTTNINGTVRYACRCGSCACGYVCGSIPLEVGGTLGGVCAPP
ncbi:MAG: hypothetical protein U0270_01860 [Labilithrix sp.]